MKKMHRIQLIAKSQNAYVLKLKREGMLYKDIAKLFDVTPVRIQQRAQNARDYEQKYGSFGVKRQSHDVYKDYLDQLKQAGLL